MSLCNSIWINKVVQPGFGERQQLYMLYDSLLIWSFWQGHAGGLPEDKTLTLGSNGPALCRVLGKIKNYA